MRSSRFCVVLFVLVAIPTTLSSCSSPATNSASGNNSAVAGTSSSTSSVIPKDNVDELTILLRLPFEPEEAAWAEDVAGKSLTAAIRFSPENAGKMSAELAKLGAGTPETLSVESWFPTELIAQGEISGESTVHGRSFPAESLLNPPYTKGRIARVDNTDYFILQISG